MPSDNFDLLKEQARFLLLVRGDTKLEQKSSDEKFDLISKLNRGFREITLPENITGQGLAAAILMASQINDMSKCFIRATSCLIEKIKQQASFEECLTLLAKQDKQLVTTLIRHARGVKQTWQLSEVAKDLNESLCLEVKPLAKSLDQIKENISLLRLILRDDNPFANEVMALKLMQAALANVEQLKNKGEHTIDLAATKVKFLHFSTIVKKEAFDAELELTFAFKLKGKLDQTWENFSSEVEADIVFLRSLGEFIRAALVGGQD